MPTRFNWLNMIYLWGVQSNCYAMLIYDERRPVIGVFIKNIFECTHGISSRVIRSSSIKYSLVCLYVDTCACQRRLWTITPLKRVKLSSIWNSTDCDIQFQVLKWLTMIICSTLIYVFNLRRWIKVFSFLKIAKYYKITTFT